MNDCIVSSGRLDLPLDFLLDFALPVFTDLYLQIERLTFIGYLHIGNAFRCTGLASHLQSAIVLPLRVLTLEECTVHLTPCLDTSGQSVGRIVPE